MSDISNYQALYWYTNKSVKKDHIPQNTLATFLTPPLYNTLKNPPKINTLENPPLFNALATYACGLTSQQFKALLDYAEYRAISVYQKYLKNVSNNSNSMNSIDNSDSNGNKYERSSLASVEDMSNINIDYEVRILMRRLLTGPKKGYTLHNIQDILQGSLDGEYIWRLLHEHEQCQLEGRVFDGYAVSRRLLAGGTAELVTAPLEDIVKTVISTSSTNTDGIPTSTSAAPKINGRPNYQQRQRQQQQKQGKGNAVSTNKPSHVKRSPKTLNNSLKNTTAVSSPSQLPSSSSATIQPVRSPLGQSPSPSLSIAPDAALVIHISHDEVNLQQSDASVFYLLKNNLVYIGFQFDYSKQTWSYTTTSNNTNNTTLLNNTTTVTTATTTVSPDTKETKGGRKKGPAGKVKPVSEVVEIVKGLCSAYKISYRLEQGV